MLLEARVYVGLSSLTVANNNEDIPHVSMIGAAVRGEYGLCPIEIRTSACHRSGSEHTLRYLCTLEEF